jgi:aryl-alcohol dehydrogenase-like predicted oxidoreductase
MEERPYGRTGETFSILSFGAMHIADISEADAIKLVNYAQVFTGTVLGKAVTEH